MSINAVWKPWYVYRPHQLVRRAAWSWAARQPGHRLMPVSWGIELWADPTENIGRSIWTTGVFDLGVSEIMFRLTRPSDLLIDAGANLGYTSLLGALAAGSSGRVLAFEPNPHVVKWLRQNVDRTGAHYQMAPVEVHESALGSAAGAARLVLPDASAGNDGLAHIAHGREQTSGEMRSVQVKVEKLDDVITARRVGLLKIDVEGYEQHVLEGLAAALHDHRIRHIVFEDHHGVGSKPMALLGAAGYEIFSIGWSMRGPFLAPAAEGRATIFAAPSYLATIDRRSALDACAPAGFLTLRRQTRNVARAVSS
jgi:FkbM family methyltransferase